MRILHSVFYFSNQETRVIPSCSYSCIPFRVVRFITWQESVLNQLSAGLGGCIGKISRFRQLHSSEFRLVQFSSVLLHHHLNEGAYYKDRLPPPTGVGGIRSCLFDNILRPSETSGMKAANDTPLRIPLLISLKASAFLRCYDRCNHGTRT